MPTALIAEDEPLLAAGLRAELAHAWPALEVVAVVGDGIAAAAQTLALAPDICFLDIRMPGCSGLEAAQAIAEDWPDARPLPLLVFVTAYDRYALQAFDAQAADYLVKPVDPVRLHACVARLQRRLGTAAPPALGTTLDQLRTLLAALPGGQAVAAAPRLAVIQASIGQTVHMVPIDEVQYFEAADKYVRVLTKEREYLIRTSLRELLPQLDAQQFWQVHRSLVVRASAIATAQRDERSEEHTSELQSPLNLVCRLLLEK